MSESDIVSSAEEDMYGEPNHKRMKMDPDEDKYPEAKARASGGAEALLAASSSMAPLHLLDEVQEDDDQSDQQCSEDSNSYDSEIPEEEIDALLEEGLPDEMKGPPKQRSKTSDATDPSQEVPYEMKEKVVLIEKGINPFEVLPEGWVEAIHVSGIPVYLHKDTRVCTFSRPYFLGSGSVRKHEVPLGAIPCLQYQKALEKEKWQMESATTVKPENGSHSKDDNLSAPSPIEAQSDNMTPKVDGNEPECPQEVVHCPVSQNPVTECPMTKKSVNDLPVSQNAGVEQDSQESVASGNVDSESTANCEDSVTTSTPPKQKTAEEGPGSSLLKEIQQNSQAASAIDYHTCESLLAEELLDYCKRRFQFKTIKLLKFRTWAEKRKYQKTMKRKNRPIFPEGTSLLSLKRPDDKNNASGVRRDWVINPKGKSYLCILHEYLQQVLKIQPKYDFSEVDNALTPYSATLTIGNIKYSTGYGSSKKQAKMEAAKNTLEILLPEFGKKFRKDGKNEETDLSFFDEIRIEDPRVPELCNKMSELSPYSVLLNCLQRNFGLSWNNIESSLITRKNQKNEFVMSVGKHTVEVQCKNKKDGKHRASQAILQKIHPHISNWGSLLRLYGNRSIQTIRERKPEMQKITLLQSNATLHQPNVSIIKKLKEEMLKLSQMKAQIQPIGKFLPPGDLSFPTKHGSELNNVDL